MTEFRIRIAECVVNVQAMFESTRDFCREYICNGTADFAVETTLADIAFEREKSAREDLIEGRPTREYTDLYLETIAVQRKVMEELFSNDVLLFHGSVVAVDGQAYLFTAKSGTGKSTHTRLWREVFGHRAVMVNDDKPLLQITDSGIFTHGSPWMGKHHLGANICVPLKAICILERGTANRITSLSAKDALNMLLQQSNRPIHPEKLPKYLELIDRLAGNTLFYRLECNTDPEAAIVAYEAMSGEKWRKE